MRCAWNLERNNRNCQFCTIEGCEDRVATKVWSAASLGGLVRIHDKEPSEEDKQADERAKTMNAVTHLCAKGWTCITPDGIDVMALKSVAQDLVDAVERYVEPKPGQEFVHRSEILLKKNALKELLK